LTFYETINLEPDEIIKAVKKMEKKKRDDLLEDLLAATSPEYLQSIKEARTDYKTQRVKRHKEVFGERSSNFFTTAGPSATLKAAI
jgi:hypothetical protein